MLNITQSKFDEIIEKIDNLELPEGYDFPDLEDVLPLLSSEKGLAVALLAAEKSEDKEYVKKVNALIMSNVVIYEALDEDSEDEDINLEKLSGNERVKRILADIHNIEFIVPGFIPTDTEIESLGEKNINKNDSDLAFLLWISELDKDDDANKLMKHAARKARTVIKAKLAV